MKILLDTNICIYLIKNRPEGVRERLRACTPGEVGISSITAGELWYGVAKSQAKTRNTAAMEAFMLPLEVVSFNSAASMAYGTLRTALEKKGTPIGPLDMLIAAHAVSLGVTLVTNNLREFKRVPGLKCVNWV
ncbi:MAG: type II toxin-antitoxin system VapC family toxin [Planctomycetes bacterium]|nr:type II toxin-antitoxin system VapC family toxin [Planctomycetota bacterium]